ncbi:MAG: LuxR C-terminal-related transcriptional regulator [Treponema sp.]
MYRRILGFITLLLTVAGASAKEYPLHPLVLRDKTGKITVNQLSHDFFSYEKYINANDGQVMWLEAELPETTGGTYAIQFNSEIFMKADVYLLLTDDSWHLIGRTGSSYYLKEHSDDEMKTIPTWNQAVPLPGDISSTYPGKIRIRIEPVKYAAVSVSLIPLPEYFRKVTRQTFWYSILIGIFICILLVLITGGLFFKSSFYLYVAGITLALTGHILSVQGFGTAYLWPWLITGGKAENMVFLFSLAALFCGTGALLSDNKRILPVKHPSQVINIVFFICMITTTFQFLVFNHNHMQSSLTLIIILIMILFFYICVKTSFFQTNTDKKLYLLWAIAVLLIIIRQIFHLVRTKSAVPVFRIFDNDMDWPVCVAILIITFPTSVNIIIRLRGKIALLEIETAAAQENTQTANSRSYAYSRVIFSLMNPMTALVNAIESPLSGTTAQSRNIVQKSSHTIKSLLNALFSLSHYESGIADIDENREPVVLLPFMMNAVEEQLCDIKSKGNLPEIKRGMSSSIVVLANKALLEVFFRYMLEPVIQYAAAGTPVLIYIDYKKSILTYSVHITSAPLSEYDARNILDLDYIKSSRTNEGKEHFYKIMSSWGIQLHIVKRIVMLHKGSMSILPDPLGNTFIAQFTLKSASLSTLEIEAVKKESELIGKIKTSDNESPRFSPKRQHTLYGEIILIIENNTDMRTILSDMFSQFYKTVSSVNGQEAFSLLKNFTPDLIITSDTLPVLSSEDLLKFCQKDNRLCSIPFFFITSFSETQRRLLLYRSGAVEIIEKPFLPEELLAKVHSFMENRRTVKSLVLADISNAVRQGMVLSSPETAPVSSPQTKLKQTAKVFTMSGQTVQRADSVQNNSLIPTSAQTALFTAANLSSREIQIAVLISQGLADKDIAVKLNISPATVAVHNKKIFKKLDIHSRLELISKTM